MKKFACHRLYLKPDECLKMACVTIDGEGRVAGYKPLTEETASTEWIGGVIFLLPQAEIASEANFHELWKAGISLKDETKPLYAWHVSNFDFEHDCLTPQSVVQRLKPDTFISL